MISIHFNGNVVSRVFAFESVSRIECFTPANNRFSYWNEYATDGRRLDFSELALCRFMVGGLDLHCISSITDHHIIVTMEIAKVVKAVPSSGVAIFQAPREIFESDVIVKNCVSDWDLVTILMAEKVESSELRCKMHELRS